MAQFEPDEPTDPVQVTIGDVFVLPPKLYASKDPRKKRPIVVVRVDPDPNGDIHFLARTKNTDADGALHPRDRDLVLDLDGVWEPMPHSMRRQFLTEPEVERRGTLSEPYLSRVLALYREGPS